MQQLAAMRPGSLGGNPAEKRRAFAALAAAAARPGAGAPAPELAAMLLLEMWSMSFGRWGCTHWAAPHGALDCRTRS